MAVQAMRLVGLDVHARQTHVAVLAPRTGEIGVSRLRTSPDQVVSFLEPAGAGGGVRGGPDGVRVGARGAPARDRRAGRGAGVDPEGVGDLVKTDHRDAIRLVRLLAAGELSFAFVPIVEDEHFRDLVRCIEEIRGDLMRARHRLGKFLLRRGHPYEQGGTWTGTHRRWLRKLHFEEACSQATFVDYLAAIELLVGRRQTLIETLEQQIPECSHAHGTARLHCFRGIDTLSATDAGR